MSPHLVALLAAIAAAQARIAGMQAENAHRIACGYSPSYGEDAFNALAADLDRLSVEARNA